MLDELKDITITHIRRDAIGHRLNALGDPCPGVGVKNGLLDSVWCAVSGGQVTIEGQTFDIQPFYIAKYLITHIQFQAFLTAKDGYEYDHWWQGLHKDGFKQAMMEQKQRYSNYPRDSISWYQAMAFSRWLNHRLQGQNFRPENTPEQVFMVSQNLEIRLPT